MESGEGDTLKVGRNPAREVPWRSGGDRGLVETRRGRYPGDRVGGGTLEVG